MARCYAPGERNAVARAQEIVIFSVLLGVCFASPQPEETLSRITRCQLLAVGAGHVATHDTNILRTNDRRFIFNVFNPGVS